MTQTRLRIAFVAPSFLERVGRKVAMDFGFGAFLEKFEEYYGKIATRVLVGAMGLAVFSACMSLVWKLLLGIEGLSDRKHMASTWAAIDIATTVLFLVLALGFLVYFIKIVRENRQLTTVRSLSTQAHELVDEARVMTAEIVKIIESASDTHAAAELVLIEAAKNALARGDLTQEQVDLIRSLASIEPKTPL